MKEPLSTELRHWELLGQAVATALASQVGKPLPHETARLLNLLELKKREKAKPVTPGKPRRGMIDKAKHIGAAAEALALFQRACGTVDAHAIADLICDLGLLADERGLDFLGETKRGIGHWFAERHAHPGANLGPDAIVEIQITAKA